MRHKANMTVDGMELELRPYRLNYVEGYYLFDVSKSSRGRKIGQVRPMYGKKQYSPDWEAVAADGTPCGSRRKMVALLGLDDQSRDGLRGLHLSRLDAIKAVVRYEKRWGRRSK